MAAKKGLSKPGSDPSLLLGLAIGFGGLLVGYILEGGSPVSLLGLSAFIIIVGGVVGALTVSFSLKHVLTIPALMKDSMNAPLAPSKEMAMLLITFAEKARREGLLSLEEDIESLNDPFLQKGVKLIVDGTDPEIVKNTLENDIYLFEERKKEEIEIFAQAGGFCPTMGIIGTVTGLVLVLGNLGGDAAALGHSIAAAFIATLYGIGFANLVFLPVANKLKMKLKLEILGKEFALIGMRSLQTGDNPSLIKDKLQSFLEEKIDSGEPAE
jgi:chemotaxis protein MotA